MIELKPGDKIWLATAPAGFEQPSGPTVIFDLSAFGLDPHVTIEAYEAADWTVIEANVAEPDESDLKEIIADYFHNDQEGWIRGWLAWRDRAAKAVGLPTSQELKELREAKKSATL